MIPTIFKGTWGAKLQVYTSGMLKIVRNEPILQMVTGLQKMTLLHLHCSQITAIVPGSNLVTALHDNPLSIRNVIVATQRVSRVLLH